MQLPVRLNYRFVFKLSLVYFVIQTFVRVLIVAERAPGIVDTFDAFLDGVIWDLGTWLLVAFPVFVYSIFASDAIHKKFCDSKIETASLFIFTFVLTFIGFCEVVFWKEFHSRFNFIAVDYLIYTNEVLHGIAESFPMPLVFALISIFAGLVAYSLSSVKFVNPKSSPFFKKTGVFSIVGMILPVMFVCSVEPVLATHDEVFHDDQIGRNGIFEFFRAFRANRIDYQSFYPVLPMGRATEVLKDLVLQKDMIPDDTILTSRPNVVIIVVESLGAKFIQALGGEQKLTPNLNALSLESLFFKNLYATGTRTVRGLEAITLSVPPTPGYSVVKRPNNKNLYSMGRTFQRNGYENTFLYGGSGFFDNMNDFFGGNHFVVIDQTDFKKSEITFENAWGVCDEDLFSKAHSILKSRDQTKPALLFMLTTSNHRPFTYPSNKIDIPSGESRAGAVKYTDYAIGKFLHSVKGEEWAQNTIFVIVADHSTEGRGQFDLEVQDFHIPMWIWSPRLFKPEIVEQRGSLIDLLPTLIDLMGLEDSSPFFGRSFFDSTWNQNRALFGNYQYVGHFKDDHLTTLGPNQSVKNFHFDPISKEQTSTKDNPFLEEAITYYQMASHLLDRGQYKAPK